MMSPAASSSKDFMHSIDDTQSVKSMRSITSSSVYSSASAKHDVKECKERILKALNHKRDVSLVKPLSKLILCVFRVKSRSTEP